MLIFDKELDYSLKETQNLISNFTLKIENNKCFRNYDLTESWINSYINYIESNNIQIDNTTHWYYILYSDYLNTEEGSIFIDDIWETTLLENNITDANEYGIYFDTSFETNFNFTGKNYVIYVDYNKFEQYFPNTIKRSRIYIQYGPIGTGTEVLAKCVDFLQKVTKNYKNNIGSYYYDPTMMFAESDEAAVSQTIINVGLASAAAFIICLVLIPFPSIALYVAYAVAQILVGVLGYMRYLLSLIILKCKIIMPQSKLK